MLLRYVAEYSVPVALTIACAGAFPLNDSDALPIMDAPTPNMAVSTAILIKGFFFVVIVVWGSPYDILIVCISVTIVAPTLVRVVLL